MDLKEKGYAMFIDVHLNPDLGNGSLCVNFLQEPCHVLPEQFHDIYALFILFHFSLVESKCEIPVVGSGDDHLADEKEMIDGIKGMDGTD